MLVLAVSLFAVFCFILTFVRLKVLQIIQQAIADTGKGAFVILDKSLSDNEKELAVQSAGLALLKASVQIFWRITASILAAVVPVYLVATMGLVTTDAVTMLMLRWDFILGTTVILGGVAWFFARLRKTESRQSAYSGADQLIHRLAFAGPGTQLAVADIENRLFARQIQSIDHRPPIFITSLPRAGTTILLTALNDIPEVATQTYRDMPFVMSPLLWSKLSSTFARKNEMTERAHGDGIQVGYDSPEAFEEVIWRAFWPKKYGDKSIELWFAEDAQPEATTFFETHFRKIVKLRTDGTGKYISKNNNNIARLDLLSKMFPDSYIVVPLREPAEHCASLMRQHKNFLKQQSEDPFIERYMRDIGHLEFGNLHTPIAFPSFDPTGSSPDKLDYWLNYWIAAYQMVLQYADQLYFVSLDKLGKHPQIVMRELCGRINVNQEGKDVARYFRPIQNKIDNNLFDARKLADATEIYQELRKYEV